MDLVKHFLVLVLFLLTFFICFSSSAFANISLVLLNVSPKDDYFEVTAKVSGMSSSSGTFVQGMFTSKDSNHYFGYTWGQKSDWVVYDGSPEKSFVIQNFVELKNDQETKVLIKPNYKDADYKGPGEYLVKLKRYTSSGGSGDYSENSLSVNLLAQVAPSVTATISTTSTIAPTQNSTPTVTKPTNSPPQASINTPTAISKITITKTIEASSTPTFFQQSEVLSLSTQSASIEAVPLSKSPPSDKNIFIIGAGIFAISGTALYFRLKSL